MREAILSAINLNNIVSFNNIKGTQLSENKSSAMRALKERMTLRKEAIEIANEDRDFSDDESSMGM